ncbi:MAG: Tim44/TimA family putative adaptor protein [Paracoccaceae bacterium]|nr:Tim44/TimA family putative adaptor protein [Paracoccaceae bacterium]
MGSGYFQLLVLAAIALFLILRLRNALGTRDGFEPRAERTPLDLQPDPPADVPDESDGIDHDIVEHFPADSPSGKALAAMKIVEPTFTVEEFVGGARWAYEIILMAFEGDDLETLKGLLASDVFQSFETVVRGRQGKGLKVEASFIGVRDTKLESVRFNKKTEEAEIAVRFISELTSVVRDSEGEIVEGDPNTIKRQTDVWTFARIMGDDDPNWILVATGE